MLSKLIAWFLAAVTALMNNLGFWQQPDTMYTGDPGYVIEEDVVNYREVQEWYTGAFQGDNICVVEATHHSAEANTYGMVFIVEGAPMNPDAQMVFSDEDVIIAPSRGKVLSQPSSSTDKIIVQNEESGSNAYRMVINKPKRWFCSEKVNPTVSGSIKHRQDDHRITLNQGDTICVASSDTTVELYVGDAGTNDLKKATLREFLHAVDGEPIVKSDPNKIMNGNTEQTITVNPDKTSIKSGIDIADERIFKGTTGWVQVGDRWRWGESGVAGKNYAANQYVIYEGDYYYFDSAGYMVTGWADDGYYYYEDKSAYAEQRSSFKEGALCYGTMVPDKDNAGYFVYIDRTGKVSMDEPALAMAAAGTTYKYNDSVKKYELSPGYSTDGSGGGSGGGGNNSGDPDIDNQGGTNGVLTDEQWSVITAEDGSLEKSMNGWYSHDGDWVHLTLGEPTKPTYRYHYTVNGEEAYICEINGSQYFFDSSTYIMFKGNHSGEDPVWVTMTKSDGITHWLVLVGDRGAAHDEWYQTSDGKWVYALSDGYLCQGSTNLGPVLKEIPAVGSGYFYAFDSNCYLDTTTENVQITGQTGRHNYKLDGRKEGSRSIDDSSGGGDSQTRW